MNANARRFNTHFIYAIKVKQKRIGAAFFILLMFLVTVCTAIIVEKQLLPIALSFAESQTRRTVILIINNTVGDVLAANNVDYSQLCNIQKNENGEIIAVVPNIIKVNELKSQITTGIQERISSSDTSEISIPLGSLTQNYLLAGRGPRIPLKILTSGDVYIDFNNSFISSGINQTKHEIILNVAINVSAILPAGRTSVKVETIVPITETIIVGKVPAAYLDNK